MSKYLSTKKRVKSISKQVYEVGYCELQNLLAYKEPFAYSTRAEGWACDYYDLPDGSTISTGYAATGMKVPRLLIKKFDDEAREIKTSNIDYNDKVSKLDNLIDVFTKELENL